MRVVASVHRRRAPAIATLALLLAACAGPSPREYARPDPARDAQTRRFAQRGYHPEARHASETVSDRWSDGADEIDIALTLPASGGPYPLVIYLPGLGEPATAGAIWRENWARAGYAVVSLQPAADGPAVWATREARNAELPRIAREHFGEDALARRLAAAGFVRRELMRRAALGTGPYARIDPAHVAVAGYDLGAQAAYALAGERAPQRAETAPWSGLAGAIALSPHVTPAAGGLEQRFAAMRVATLSVTGYDDRDSYGIGTSPSARQAPYRFGGARQAYLLMLDGLAHRALAGNATPDPNQPGDAEERTVGRPSRGSAAGPPDADGGGARGPRPGMRPANGPGGRGGTAVDERPRGDAARQRIVIEQVSLAFLDATLRGDAIAREWLERNAPRWADPIANLQTRP